MASSFDSSSSDAFLSDLREDSSINDSQQPRSSTQYSFTPAPENSKTSTKPDIASNSQKKEDDDDEKRDDSMFVCNICLDIAKDAVVSFCGHLYCWACLSMWLETKPNRQTCPVCKAAISKDKVVPLYGRNSENQDPRSKIPPRPQGQRTEPDNNQAFQGFQSFGGDGGHFHLSFGIGAFPFGFFASSFNFNDIRPRNGQQQQPGSPQYEEDQFLSKVFLWVAMIFFCWLILA